MGMFREFANKVPMTETFSNSELYEQLKELIRKEGYYLKSDPGEYKSAFHRILKVAKPRPTLMTTWPEGFRVTRIVSDTELSDFLEKIFSKLSHLPELLKFATPLLKPDPNSRSASPAIQFVTQMSKAKTDYEEQYSEATFELGISHQPDKCPPGRPPAMCVPPASWIDPKVRKLTEEQLLPIFPPAERQLYMIWLGRALVGRNGNIQVHDNKPVHHSARLAIAAAGPAGIGKSTLMNYVVNTMRFLGYKVRSFQDLGRQFGNAPIATAELAYSDDMTEDTFESTLKAPLFKSLVTNSTVTVEAKGVDPVEIHSNCAIVFNTNTISKNFLSYKADPGALSRFRVLKTYTEMELPSHVKSASYYPNLAKEIGCSIEDIFFWLFRMSVDKFLDLIKDDPSRDMIAEIDRLTLELLSHVDAGLLESLAMMLVTIAKSSDIVAESHMPAPLLNHLFTIYRHLAIDPSCIEVRKELEDHWIATGRRSQHPWNAIRLINLESVDYAYKESQVALASSPNRKELFIKELFGGVRTTHMTMISHNSVTVTEAWLLAIQSLPGLPTIKSLANIDTDNLSFKTDVSHLYSIKKIKR